MTTSKKHQLFPAFTGEQLEILKCLNCDAVQGFYYAKPMPEQEFVAYVQQRERMM